MLNPPVRDTTSARLLSVAAYRPRARLGNDELAREHGLDTSDTWIRRRTGIAARRIAQPRESLEFMGARAAEVALDRAGFTRHGAEAPDCVVAASMSHLDSDQSLARGIGKELGGVQGAFDVSAACAGFCVGLELARCLVATHAFRRVLVVAAERMSDVVDPHDRTTSVIFADGAGAGLVCASPEPEIGPVAWGTHGREGHLLRRSPMAPVRVAPDGPPAYLAMRGPELYRWVTEQVPSAAREALDKAGVQAHELGAFVPHQANDRMTTALVGALGLPSHVVVAHDVVSSGNTSAASVPMAVDALLAEQPRLSGALALLVGFGAGVTYAAQVVKLP
ncbi:beta-ketoacyl-ACP synthase 3 [Streptomyces sp. NPDC087300]|uniref:beta-ketoacyl-ACP synthase 3 n=1 Tax=Streptomyces sp. NPDC087300 TaxID=3365780 RepID=UPI003826D0A3